jgi:hypothetical protein
MQHPSLDLMIRFVERQLEEGERASIEEHISLPCAECQVKMRRLETVLQRQASQRDYMPPAAVLRKAFAVYRKRDVVSGEVRLPARARLLFDSWLQPSLAGVRGHLQTRQMLFRVGGVDIDLQITPGGDDRRLVGQILGSEDARGGPSAFVSLTGKHGEVFQGAEADHLGQFAFRSVPFGTYDLVFDIEGQEIAITDIDLGDDG